MRKKKKVAMTRAIALRMGRGNVNRRAIMRAMQLGGSEQW